MTALSLAALLEASRLFELRTAIVGACAARFAGVEVKSHPGRLDGDDIAGERNPFVTPSLNVAVVRVQGAEGRLSGHRDVPVEIAIYVVTADQAVGEHGLVTRDELGLALCDGVLALVEDPDVARWGLTDIAPPELASAGPVFTALSNEKGTAFYAVTWRQTLYTLGHPFRPMEGAPPAGFSPYVYLPGDPPPPPGDAP